MSKPILFLCSSHVALNIENLYFLKDLGKVLDLNDDRVKDEDIKADGYDYIICNVKEDKQVQKLRFISRSDVHTVCVLRRFESASSDWVVKSHADFVIKDLTFIKDCKQKEELVNFITHLNNLKVPESDLKFYFKKVFGFFLSCVRRGD